MARQVSVEVVYATAEHQELRRFSVVYGTTARELVLQSGMQALFAELDLENIPLGIFGKVLSAPQQRVLEDGERVEMYRPLLADPKEVRKQRAARARVKSDGR